MRSTLFLIGASLLVAPVAAQQTTPSSDSAAPASSPATSDSAGSSGAGASTTAATGPAQVVAGAAVSDTSGGAVGKIVSVSGGDATVDTGTVKAAIPVTSFAQGQSGLVLAMTKTQLEAAAAAAKPTEIAVGTQVVGPKGAAVGTVAAVNGDLVTVQMPKSKVQLPKNAFAQSAGGGLAIGMTQEQLEAATAKAAQKPS